MLEYDIMDNPHIKNFSKIYPTYYIFFSRYIVEEYFETFTINTIIYEKKY